MILSSANLAGCGPAEDANATADFSASAHANNGSTSNQGNSAAWTVFVYGHADHNLSATFVADLAEMSAAKIASNVNVIVLADFDSSQSLNNKKFPSGWKLYRVVGDNKNLVELESGPELNLDKPAVLASMTEKVFTQFPAERRAIVMWDHGGSWAGGFGGDTDDGTLTAGQIRPMRVIDVTASLRDGLAKAGIDKARPLDLLAFDTCLMASAEVMTEAQELASVYVANAELDFGRGWDYAKSFSWLSAHPHATAQEFAKAEVQIWDEHHKDASLSDSMFRAHGAFDLEKWDDFVDSAATLVNVATSTIDSAGRQGYFTLPTYNSGLEFRAQDPNLRDAGMFAERLAKGEGPLSEAAARLTGSLSAATLGLSLGSFRESLSQMGLHLELTTGKAFEPVAKPYATLAPSWNQRANWSALLQSLSDADDLSKPVIQSRVVAPGELLFTVNARDAADAKLIVGTRTDDGLVPLAPIAHAEISPERTYAAEWNGFVYVTNDGEKQQQLSVLPWLSILAEHPTQIYSTLMQAETGEQLAFLFTENSNKAEVTVVMGPTPAVLTVEELVRITPDLRVAPIYRAFKGTLSKDTLGEFMKLPETGLPISVAPAECEQFVVVTAISDYWGNLASVENNVQRPAID